MRKPQHINMLLGQTGHLAKVEVVGSNPIARSSFPQSFLATVLN